MKALVRLLEVINRIRPHKLQAGSDLLTRDGRRSAASIHADSTVPRDGGPMRDGWEDQGDERANIYPFF